MDKKRRVINPPLSGWLGGKSRLARAVIERIPPHVCYVEPFAGAAWVLFKKEPSRAEVLNDISRDIANLYRAVRHHPDELARQFAFSLASREEFERLKATPPDVLTDIQRAARFLYLQKRAFGGKVEGASFGTAASGPPAGTAEALMGIIAAGAKRLDRVIIENLPYADCIRRYDRPRTFFYLDPPYFGCENDYGKGLFGRSDFAALAGLLAGIKGKFLMSLNDRPEVRETFAAFRLEEVKTTYTCGNNNKTPAQELFISNY